MKNNPEMSQILKNFKIYGQAHKPFVIFNERLYEPNYKSPWQKVLERRKNNDRLMQGGKKRRDY